MDMTNTDTILAHLTKQYAVWDEHPTWPSDDWKYEVANGDTRAGYWDWVASQIDGHREE